jgi:hypothetical protein
LLKLALDWDSTLVNAEGAWLPGARETLMGLLRHHRVVIHSARANWDGGKAQIEAMLPKHEHLRGVYGKPLADLYIGDGYMNFAGDWQPILDEIRRR